MDTGREDEPQPMSVNLRMVAPRLKRHRLASASLQETGGKMSGFRRIALAFFLATAPVPAAFALDNAPATISQELVPFSSDEGLARLARSTAKVDFPSLANQFEAESNGAFCGPTSAAIALNAIRDRSPDLPRDRSRLHSGDPQYIPNAD